jgi:hypothetical protein
MKNRIFSISALVILLSAWLSAQQVIKVKSANSKDLIYTLKNGEEIYTEETFITFTSNGTRYEITTELNDKYYIHTNKAHFGPYDFPPGRFSNGRYLVTKFSKDSTARICFLLNINDGTKLGPFENLRPYFDNNYNLLGYEYDKNEKSYLCFTKSNRTIGPFDQIYSNCYDEKVMLSEDIFYQVGDAVYRNNKGKISAPMHNFKSYFVAGTETYSYGDEKSGFLVMMDNKVLGPYKNLMVSEHRSILSYYVLVSPYFIKEPNGIYDGYALLSSGVKVPSNAPEGELSYVIELEDKSWIKLEKTDAIKAAHYNWKKSPQNSGWYIHYSNGTSFGPFAMKDTYNSIRSSKSGIYFLVSDFQKNTSSGYNNSIKGEDIFVFSNGKKYLFPKSPDPDAAIELYANDKNWFALKNGKLLHNGECSPLKNVRSVRFSFRSDDWYAITNSVQNDSSDIYKNGLKIKTIKGKNAELQNVQTVANGGCILNLKINGWPTGYYFNGKTEIGPQQNEIMDPVILNKRHIGFIENYTNVVINGKDKGEGAVLTGNEVSGTFHWMSTESNKVYLHSCDPQ